MTRKKKFELDDPLNWREIPGHEGLYAAHPSGRIASLRSEKVLKPFLLPRNERSYQMVSLPREGRYINNYVHRLILQTFVGPCPSGHEAHFINGDTTDTRLENLRWERVTVSRQKHKRNIPTDPDDSNLQ